MATYLLLRDNKESGPHTLDALVKIGLKAYDLVWIEGKSAAWRYPSEINELQPYAPIAEEQPFDRFYKKPADDKIEEPPPSQENKEYERFIPPVRQEPVTAPSKRSVFVTLPGGSRIISETPKKEQPAPVPPPVKKAIPPPVVDEDVAEVAEIKFSQPLDDIKEMYVKTLQDRKSRIARRSLVIAGMKKAAVIAGLVGIGLLAGFLLRKKPLATVAVAQQAVPAASFTNQIQHTDETADQQKETVIADDQTANVQESTPQNFKVTQEEFEKTQQPATTIRLRKETMITPKEKKQFDEEQVSPGVDVDETTGERNRNVRSNDGAGESKAILKSHKHELISQVSVTSNDYKRVAFGGIRNLQLTVTNNSKFELDHVIVELQYLKPSEEPLRTENIRFKAIAPNESATVKIPDTNRGIKVTYKIISIESKQRTDDVAGM